MEKISIVAIVTILSLLSCSVKNAEESNESTKIQNPEEIKVVVEDMPTFLGGDVHKFQTWVQENVKYPEIAKENGIEGKVFIMFVVEPDGSISNVAVLRGVDPALDNAAVKAVQSSPKWEYQNRRGEQVSVRFRIEVDFKLN